MSWWGWDHLRGSGLPASLGLYAQWGIVLPCWTVVYASYAFSSLRRICFFIPTSRKILSSSGIGSLLLWFVKRAYNGVGCGFTFPIVCSAHSRNTGCIVRFGFVWTVSSGLGGSRIWSVGLLRISVITWRARLCFGLVLDPNLVRRSSVGMTHPPSWVRSSDTWLIPSCHSNLTLLVAPQRGYLSRLIWSRSAGCGSQGRGGSLYVYSLPFCISIPDWWAQMACLIRNAYFGNHSLCPLDRASSWVARCLPVMVPSLLSSFSALMRL